MLTCSVRIWPTFSQSHRKKNAACSCAGSHAWQVYTCPRCLMGQQATAARRFFLESRELVRTRMRERILEEAGKCWRLVRHWYSNLVSQVKLGTHLSRPFHISRGICQGSVLSPTLFNLVLDPLLSALKERNLGLSINGLYLGAFAHANDIRTCATNIEDAAEQVSTMDTFTQSRLCLEKCALLSSGHTPTNITAAGTLLSGILGEVLGCVVGFISLQQDVDNGENQ